MNKRNLIIFLAVAYVLSAIVPYLFNIFHSKLALSRNMAQFAVNLFCFFVLISSSILLMFILQKGAIRILIIVLPVFIVIFYFLSYKYQARLGDMYFFSSREEALTEFVTEISMNNKIQYFFYNGNQTLGFNDDPDFDSLYYTQVRQMGNENYWNMVVEKKYQIEPETYSYF